MEQNRGTINKPHSSDHLIFDKGVKNTLEKETTSQTNGTVREWDYIIISRLAQKSFKQIKNINIKPETQNWSMKT